MTVDHSILLWTPLGKWWGNLRDKFLNIFPLLCVELTIIIFILDNHIKCRLCKCLSLGFVWCVHWVFKACSPMLVFLYLQHPTVWIWVGKIIIKQYLIIQSIILIFWEPTYTDSWDAHWLFFLVFIFHLLIILLQKLLFRVIMPPNQIKLFYSYAVYGVIYCFLLLHMITNFKTTVVTFT